MKVQCVVYQWIRLDKLYKLMEAFFKFGNHFLNQLQFFKIIVALGLCMRGGRGICADQHVF